MEEAHNPINLEQIFLFSKASSPALGSGIIFLVEQEIVLISAAFRSIQDLIHTPAQWTPWAVPSDKAVGV